MISPDPDPSPTPAPRRDPVRARREQYDKYTRLAKSVGYTCYLVSMVTFVIGFVGSFNGTVSAIVIGGLVVGSILLAPAIVLGYAVKAAERDDRERGL
ncbi:MAG: hypothetical protein Q7V88_18735 [Actinomycetota bacterium]|nr:hypothetical protein [Actinomycetota bacterium]